MENYSDSMDEFSGITRANREFSGADESGTGIPYEASART